MATTRTAAKRVTAHTALRYGEMAIALYAADDLPYPERRRLSPQELAAHAAQGITRLGGVDRLRALHDDLMAANRALVHREISEPFYQVRVDHMLTRASQGAPDSERFNRCIGYDYARLRAA